MYDWAALCYGSWRQVKPAIRSFVFSSFFLFFFEERGENIKTLWRPHLLRAYLLLFSQSDGILSISFCPKHWKKQEATGTRQVNDLNETKVLFAEKICHKNLLPGLQIPYKFFPKSFLMLFTAIFRLRNILPHKSMDNTTPTGAWAACGKQLCSTSRKPVSDWLHSFHG